MTDVLEYAELIRREIQSLHCLIERVSIDIEQEEDSNFGIIRGTLYFKDSYIFYFTEVFLETVRRYRFHYTDRHNHLIFRCDNAPHHKDIKTFPYHIHIPDGIKECGSVSLTDMLYKVSDIVVRELEKLGQAGDDAENDNDQRQETKGNKNGFLHDSAEKKWKL